MDFSLSSRPSNVSAFQPRENRPSIVDEVRFSHAGLMILAPALVYLWWSLVSHKPCRLGHYPGPFLARWTNLWRLWQVMSGEYPSRIKRLHEKYGPVVRIGPNTVDIDMPDPGLIRTIYGTDTKWRKSDFYQNSSVVLDGRITYHLFSETDGAIHARMKRPIARHYSPSVIMGMEPFMDRALDHLSDHLEKRFAAPGKVCQLGDWIDYFTWDLLGMITFSKMFGYMDAAKDFDHSIAISARSLDYLAACGQMPWLDHWLDKNPVCKLGPPGLDNVTGIAVRHLMCRLRGEDENYDPERPDFLQGYIDSKNSHPETVDEKSIVGYLLLNLLAGADTTAIAIRAVFYYCLKDGRIWSRLQDEILASVSPTAPAPYQRARKLPYLDAVCRESIRFHPSVCMIMERVVPEGGAGLALPDGSVVPPGTGVGMSPYIINRNTDLFGPDADRFRPERWLQQEGEEDDRFARRTRLWAQTDINFGAGSRICLGRNLALTELYKVVATLISRFEIMLDDPNEELRTMPGFLYRSEGVVARIRRREAWGG